jgi:dTDP-glucose 4,6-dehydratase/UDP-glucuronate decarboxylase
MYNFNVILDDCIRLKEEIKLEKFKNSTILITGANGLIGGFLADLFCHLNDFEDYRISLYLTSYSKKSKASRIEHLVERSDVNYFSWDCSKPLKVQKIPKKIDYLFFCSGYGQPSKFLKNNVKTSLINIVGIEALLSHMSKTGGGNALFLSTSEIYGDVPPDKLPTPEDYGGYYNLQNNREAYKMSKKMGEVICKEYNCFDNINVKIARVALTYGPGSLLNDQRVMQEFIFKANFNKKIKMLDEGNSIRNYLYITDSVKILLNIIKDGKHLVYNVGGTEEPISIYDLALKIGQIFKVPVIKGQITNKENKSAPKNVRLKMDRYKNEFSDNNSFINLNEGIKNVIKWYKFQEVK